MKMFEVHGIKCDTKNCGYSDMTVPSSDYKNWLNKPCPKCSGNLLTQQDYDTVLQMEKISELKIIKFLTFVEVKVRKLFGLKTHALKAEMNGTGKLNLKIHDDE